MKYLLLLFYLSTPGIPAMHSAGPFDGLLACEKAAGQAQAAAHEAGMRRLGTTCVSVKAPDFRYKEPRK